MLVFFVGDAASFLLAEVRIPCLAARTGGLGSSVFASSLLLLLMTAAPLDFFLPSWQGEVCRGCRGNGRGLGRGDSRSFGGGGCQSHIGDRCRRSLTGGI